MRDYFVFDGRSSLEFDIWVFEKKARNVAVRSTETVVVPGRNGSLEIDNRRHENTPAVYWCLLADDGREKSTAFFDWLSSKKGYLRLEDTKDMDEYMLARYIGGTEVDRTGNMSKWQLEFDCQPQHYLKSGEEPIEMTGDATTLLNPTNQIALPHIRLYGTGEFECVSGGEQQLLRVNENSSYIDFDCELRDAHRDAVNCNAMFSGQFPEFRGGNVSIAMRGISKAIITPRWFRL